MKLILALLLGIAIGAAGLWFYTSSRGSSSATPGRTGTVADQVQDKLRSLNIRPEDIKEELARGGQVVRTKAQQAGHAIADATADARATATIKAKLIASRELSGLNISVNTTAGVVTLSGSVSSQENVSKAMLLAMETDGVREVISTLQVKPPPRRAEDSAVLPSHPPAAR